MKYLTELPYLQQKGLDFESIIQDLQEIISNNPRWSSAYSTFMTSEAGTMLIEMMAYLADNLSIKIDSMINEFFPSTVSRDTDKIQLLKLINYLPKGNSPSKLFITITTSQIVPNMIVLSENKKSTQSLSSNLNNIKKVYGNDVYGNILEFEFLTLNSEEKPNYFDGVFLPLNNGSADYESNSNKEDLYLLQGSTKYLSFTSNTSEAPKFVLTDAGIDQNSIRIFDEANLVEHLKVRSFLSKEATSKNTSIPFVIRLSDSGQLEIQYASASILSSESKRFQAGRTIGVYYRVNSGSLGNIPPMFLNQQINLTTISGEVVSANIYNKNYGVNGGDLETLDQALENGPLSIRTMERAVTYDDYNVIIGQYLNGFITQSKNYTSSNMPPNFKSVYGRYINPQEIISYLVTTQGFNVPSSKANNFQFFTKNEINMFNERYSFDQGEFNLSVQKSDSIPELYLTSMTNQLSLYRNASIITIDSAFMNGLVSSVNSDGSPNYNENLRLKLHKDFQENLVYFNGDTGIPMSLLYDIGTDYGITETQSRNSYLSVGNPSLSINTNAKFISLPYIKKGFPFNIKNYDSFSFVLDGKNKININLKADWREGKDNAANPYWIYMTNDILPDLNYAPKGLMEDADERRGLIELINSQVFELSQSSDSFNQYNNQKSYQYLNMNYEGKNDVVQYILPNFSGNAEWYGLSTINDKIYKFKFSNALFANAMSYFPGRVPEISNLLSYSIMGMALMIDYQLDVNNSPLNNPLQVWQGNVWVNQNGIPGIRCDCVIVNQFESDFDYSGSTEKSLVYLKYDIVFYTTDSTGFLDGTQYLKIGFDAVSSIPSLINSLKGYDDSVDIDEILPDPKFAANYNDVASIYSISSMDEYGNSIDEEHLQIVSPLVGPSSSIYFVHEGSISNFVDFMKDIFGVDFENRLASDADNNQFSNKAFGLKRLTLLLEDPVLAVYGNGLRYENSLFKGMVIYENNATTFPMDIYQVFASYKLSTNDSLEVGSVYENFYYTGNYLTDEEYKPKVEGLLGEVMDLYSSEAYNATKYTLNKIKSNYLVKFTQKPVLNASTIYNIKQDLDVLEMKTIKLYTTEISSFSASSSAKLVFTIDGMDPSRPFIIDFSGCYNGNDIKKRIISFIENIDNDLFEVYKNNINSIIGKSYESINQFYFGNLERVEGSNITFYFDEDAPLEANQYLYSSLFGNENDTITNVYSLYEEENYPDNISTDPSGVNMYMPLLEKPLSFDFREKLNGKIRRADYFFDVVNGVDKYGNQSYKFFVSKTTYSAFMDTPFYMHFVNDRKYVLDRDGNKLYYQEDSINDYISKYKISGMDVTFEQPFFKTFDVSARVYYNRNFSYNEVLNGINDKLALYNYENQNIAEKLYKSRVIKDISSVEGVSNVSIDYFGFDVTQGNSLEILPCDFNEIIVIRDDEKSGNGIITRGRIINLIQEDEL